MPAKNFKSKFILKSLLLLFSVAGSSCQQQLYTKTFTVENKLAMARKAETVSVPVSQVSKMVEKFGAGNVVIREAASKQALVTQPLDVDMDGKADEILFQTDINPNEKKKFTIEGLENGAALQPKPKLTTYSRFVPERTDDYTWENDRVAFRTYGPVAQQLAEAGKPDGTLTSGMDAWLKRVEYPVIDKWYKKYTDKTGSYHNDTGEGYDPYHVGPSRGLGGIGIWKHDKLYVSKNFTGYKTIATGPIRTVFELTYAPWQADGVTVTETKRISLDLGSNLSRHEVRLQSAEPLPDLTIGITLHDKKGTVKANQEQGWFRYWEPMDNSELGTGIVADPAVVKGYTDYRVNAPDRSHLFVHVNPTNNKVIYYTGFGWKRSGQFTSPEEWDAYLADFAARIASPLEVEF
ncbi:DUF4861 domain-containing protein [Botryobacter ruber]|uniref:DUF4861 domain-containing protein n=1 Tax=Botryobacter ruber TaxID=2171629 RepID=UPI0013E39AF4|nr:DUF4861 domain-containing protein [Botryobacter ruber]